MKDNARLLEGSDLTMLESFKLPRRYVAHLPIKGRNGDVNGRSGRPHLRSLFMGSKVKGYKEM